jgi:hypothetical protein
MNENVKELTEALALLQQAATLLQRVMVKQQLPDERFVPKPETEWAV